MENFIFLTCTAPKSCAQEQILRVCVVTRQDGIQPMWEDARNRSGGRWIINLDKKRRAIELDHFWLEMVCVVALTSLCQVNEGMLQLMVT